MASRQGRSMAVVGAVLALVVVLGVGGAAESQTGPDQVVIALGANGTLTTAGACDGTSTQSLEPATITVRREGDTSLPLSVNLLWGGTIDPEAFDAPASLTIAAGSDEAVFEVQSGSQVGTVSIEITEAGATDTPYAIGDPANAMADVLPVIADPSCPQTTTTDLTLEPPTVEPPAAEPLPASASYTG